MTWFPTLPLLGLRTRKVQVRHALWRHIAGGSRPGGAYNQVFNFGSPKHRVGDGKSSLPVHSCSWIRRFLVVTHLGLVWMLRLLYNAFSWFETSNVDVEVVKEGNILQKCVCENNIIKNTWEQENGMPQYRISRSCINNMHSLKYTCTSSID